MGQWKKVRPEWYGGRERIMQGLEDHEENFGFYSRYDGRSLRESK
jgi:hypothetical protein